MVDIKYFISWSIVIMSVLTYWCMLCIISYFFMISSKNHYIIVGSSFIFIAITNSQGALNTMQFIMLISSLMYIIFYYIV